MSENIPTHHQPYEWGSTAFDLPPLARKELPDEVKKTVDAQYGQRVGHPNVAEYMATTGGNLPNDLNDRGTEASRNAMRAADDNGNWDQLRPGSIDAVNRKFYQDAEERLRTHEALTELGAVAAELANSGTKYWGRSKVQRQQKYLEIDQAYLKGRLDTLSRHGGDGDYEHYEGDSQETQNLAWDDTMNNFLDTKRADGQTNRDILHEQALLDNAGQGKHKEED